MKIIISEGVKKPKKIVIPNFLFLSPPSLVLFSSYINKKTKKEGGEKIKYSQLVKFAKAIKESKKHLGGEWNIVEAETGGGEKVVITV